MNSQQRERIQEIDREVHAARENYYAYMADHKKWSSLYSEFLVCFFAAITAIVLLWTFGGWYFALAIIISGLGALRTHANVAVFEREHPGLDRYSDVGPPGSAW